MISKLVKILLIILLSSEINAKQTENLSDEELCDQIVYQCQDLVIKYDKLVKTSDNEIKFLREELDKEQNKLEIPWYLWILIGVGVGSQLK